MHMTHDVVVHTGYGNASHGRWVIVYTSSSLEDAQAALDKLVPFPHCIVLPCGIGPLDTRMHKE